MVRDGTNRSDFLENSVEECPIELLSGRDPFGCTALKSVRW